MMHARSTRSRCWTMFRHLLTQAGIWLVVVSSFSFVVDDVNVLVYRSMVVHACSLP